MRRKTGWLLGATLVLLIGVSAVAAARGRAAPERAYTVGQIVAGLARTPAAWVGRVVLVRGRAVIPLCPARSRAQFCPGARLVDPAVPARFVALTWRGVSPLLSVALSIPYVNSAVARRVGGVGVYRVLLTRSVRLVPASGLPHYFPYTEQTVPSYEEGAVLVNGLS